MYRIYCSKLNFEKGQVILILLRYILFFFTDDSCCTLYTENETVKMYCGNIFSDSCSPEGENNGKNPILVHFFFPALLWSFLQICPVHGCRRPGPAVSTSARSSPRNPLTVVWALGSEAHGVQLPYSKINHCKINI